MNNTKLSQGQAAFLNSVKYFDREWTKLAACRDKDQSLFFLGFGPEKLKRINRTKRIAHQRKVAEEGLKICATCPVIEQCKRDHLHEMDWVFWGTVPSERVTYRQKDWKTCDCLPCRYRRNNGANDRNIQIRSIGQQRRQERDKSGK